MEHALSVVIVLTTVLVVAAACRRYDVSAPLVLVVVGAGASFVPGFPDVELTPDLVLIGLLPPLLYAAAIRTSLVDFKRNTRPIALLSVGLVVFTAVGVGLLMWWMLDVPLAAAIALGAVVAPPDAVAATAIARKVGMPRRVVTILEGESLVNDATAIVLLRTATGAMVAGGVTAWAVAEDFAVSAFGALAIGIAVAWVVTTVRRHTDLDPTVDVAVSLLTPWVAYLPAEEIHASGVLSVVVAGLIIGHRSPVVQSASSRVVERALWTTIGFLLENAVFLLIGMQVRMVLDDLSGSDLAPGEIVAACAAALVAVIVLRIAWVFPATYAARLIPGVRPGDDAPPWRYMAVLSWAGMRGVVTLAAVFLLPESTPHREVFVAIALVVTAGTLLLQGLTLPLLVRALGVRGPDVHEDHLQQATVYERAARAGLRRLDEVLDGAEAPEVVDRLRSRSIERADAMWERLGGADEPPSAQYARLRSQMLDAERAELLRIRGRGRVDQEVLRRVMAALDVEESILDRTRADSTEQRDDDLAPADPGWTCEDLQTFTEPPTPLTPGRCEGCVRDGTTWVHLRVCFACGYVGCCDSSTGRHAEAHWSESGHPVMGSHEPGEAWRWCYEHGVIG